MTASLVDFWAVSAALAATRSQEPVDALAPQGVSPPRPTSRRRAGRRTTSLGVVEGVVAKGMQLGRQLGFPTANIPLEGTARPRTGVYVTRSRLADGRAFFGVASIGCNPTIPKESPVLEVWLFDFDEDIYGRALSTELLAYLRPEQRFDSVTALIDQVFADAEQARRYCTERALSLT